MKKIIALALVLVMALSMTTVAFAATPPNYEPGDEITFDVTELMGKAVGAGSFAELFGYNPTLDVDGNADVVAKTKIKTDLVAAYDAHKAKVDAGEDATAEEAALVAEIVDILGAGKGVSDYADALKKADADITAAKKAVTGPNDANKERASYYMSSDYFNLTVKFEKGRDLVEKWELKDGEVIITLKKSSELARPKIPNLVFDEIKVTAKRTEDFLKVDNVTEVPVKRGTEFLVKNLNMLFVGWDKDSTTVAPGDDIDLNLGQKGIWKFDDSEQYGTTAISFADLAWAELRVYKDESFYLAVDAKVDMDVVKANPDADLEFVNLAGDFGRMAAFELYADEDAFVYEYKNGKLTPSKLKWDKDAYAWAGKVSTLGTYVISDVELKNLVIDKDAAKGEDAKNPNTGANDVVGVAVALAVVSLVAAGAVSLKK